MSLYLPGHSVLQVLFCTDMPSQKAPPLRGAGFVQVRERFCTPRPQRTLQGDQSVHEDQPPFTACAKGWTDNTRMKTGLHAVVNNIFSVMKNSTRVTAQGFTHSRQWISYRGGGGTVSLQRWSMVSSLPSSYTSCSDLLPKIMQDDWLISSFAVIAREEIPCSTIVHLS